ncbi:DUF4411 family protein [Maribacter sp. 1_2014MBL_MicDiv]|uniref:DUF4411 family protein n=1 Tax=Maribacter sp. 1_2014MBL_MicDiv TaxID=1644130 RepID=UPI0008F5FE18|nr:DUF4411 family protein [Maribacter sp. 1_2014MBL_MicDiv]APA63107.1 twitching motility protein PilT [Maribacter sp. 1_2014MBL_MicDiv]
MNKYILDSNFFIQAHRSIYPLDVVQSFWLKINSLSQAGIISSIDKVKKEIYDNSSHEDELKLWCDSNLSSNFFINTDGVLQNYISIVSWTNSMSHHYTPNAIQEFLETDLADPWLIAFAMSNNWTIVTYEKSQPERKNRIKIPEVCNHFNVTYINTIQMFRELNESF